MLQRLSIVLAQIQAENTSQNLLNEFSHIVYSLHWAKKITKKVYRNTMKSIKLYNRIDTIFMNSEKSKTSDTSRLLPNLPKENRFNENWYISCFIKS